MADNSSTNLNLVDGTQATSDSAHAGAEAVTEQAAAAPGTDASESTPAREAATGPADAQTAEPAREGKAKKAKPAKAAADPLAPLTPERRLVVEKAEEEIHALGRRSTAACFTLGEVLLTVRGCYEDAADWKAWVNERGHMDMRTAENYIGLPTKLGAYRKRLEASAAPLTVCNCVANADPAAIEQVLERFEQGPRPTLGEVRAIVNGSASAEPETEIDPANVGGLAGMRALGVAKVKEGAKVFAERIAGILAEIEPALEPYRRGKRVAKAALGKAIEGEARRARSELHNVAMFVAPWDTGPAWNVHPVSFPAGTRWRGVDDILYKLGGVADWPAAGELGSWLANDVVQTLEWAIGRKPKAEIVADADVETSVETKPDGSAKTKSGRKAKSDARLDAKPKAAASRNSVSRPADKSAGVEDLDPERAAFIEGVRAVKLPDGTEGIVF